MGQSISVANAFAQEVNLEVTQIDPDKSSQDQGIPTLFTTLLKREVVRVEVPKPENEKEVAVTLSFKDNDVIHIITELKVEKAMEEIPSWILTREGKLIESGDGPWLGKDGKDYQDDTCPACDESNQICEICFVEMRMSFIGYHLSKAKEIIPQKSLMQFLAEVKSKELFAANAQVHGMLDEVMEVAMKYQALEVQTRVVVGKIKVYGESWKEAAKDFLDDGIWKDFLFEIFNIKAMDEELKKATEENSQVRGQVDHIRHKAKNESDKFENKKEAAQKNVEKMAKLVRSPFSNTLLAACIVIPVTLPEVFIGAGLYSAFLIITNAKLANSVYEAKAYQELEDEAGNIFTQMTQVEQYLGMIVDTLVDVTEKLQSSTAANDKFNRVTDQEKKKKMAERSMEKAKDLIQACQTYLNMTRRRNLYPQIKNDQ